MSQQVLANTRPHHHLFWVYVARALLSGPFIIITAPLLFARFHTLRYRFDDQGVAMRWGILVQREVNLTFARIQDIHIHSGPLQRWLGLAEVHVQTASGSATAEMVIEGLKNHQEVRDFLYSNMRGARDRKADASTTAGTPGGPGEVELLQALLTELKATRTALQSRTER
ncbi:MAG: PH domain-containing protein [Acidobacteriota bacterium]